MCQNYSKIPCVQGMVIFFVKAGGPIGQRLREPATPGGTLSQLERTCHIAWENLSQL